MSKYKYYIFDFSTHSIGTFDLMEKAPEVFTRITPYVFADRKFDRIEDLLGFLNLHNAQTAHEYKEEFGIRAPYSITQSFQDDMCNTYIHTKCSILRFTNHWFRDNISFSGPVADYLWKNRCSVVSARYFMELHNVILSTMVFIPRTSSMFNIVMKNGKITRGVVSRGASGYYLRIIDYYNNAVFKSYNIPREALQKVLGIPLTGDWPESQQLEGVYDIINFVNDFNAEYESDGKIKIQDNEIIYKGCSMSIVQLRNKKWYIKGEDRNIFTLFKVRDMTEMREYANKILGKKFRAGVFPECDSREEILELINKLQ